MRILLLSDPNSAHTIKWANILEKKGLTVFVWGLSAYHSEEYRGNITVKSSFVKTNEYNTMKTSTKKIIYLQKLVELKRFITEIKPDIVHAHYATSYGLLALLSGFRPFIVSVWGTDVYNFPNYSFLHRWLFTFIIKNADIILSTSEIMKSEVAKYTARRIEVTPFGVDLNVFKPDKNITQEIIVGTVKSLEKKYGISDLIKAFKELIERLPGIGIRLLIVGQGSELETLKALTKKLSIEHLVEFTGYVSPKNISSYHNKITIPVFLSIENSESFGVSAVEAAACGKAIVATKVSGYLEVIEDNKTGLLVEPMDVIGTTVAIEKLIREPELREKMGRSGRERVIKMYDLDKNAQKMINIYNEVHKKYE